MRGLRRRGREGSHVSALYDLAFGVDLHGSVRFFLARSLALRCCVPGSLCSACAFGWLVYLLLLVSCAYVCWVCVDCVYVGSRPFRLRGDARITFFQRTTQGHETDRHNRTRQVTTSLDQSQQVAQSHSPDQQPRRNPKPITVTTRASNRHDTTGTDTTVQQQHTPLQPEAPQHTPRQAHSSPTHRAA